MFWDLERDDFHHFKLTRWTFGKIISFFYSILGRFLSRIPTRNSMILGIKSFLLVPRQISNILYLVPFIFRRFSLKYLHIFQSDWIDSGLNLNLTLKQTKKVKMPKHIIPHNNTRQLNNYYCRWCHYQQETSAAFTASTKT